MEADNRAAIAVLQTKMEMQNVTLQEVRKEQKQQGAAITALTHTVTVELHAIRQELTARKEYGRGIKAGLAITWMLIGGAVASLIKRLMEGGGAS